MNHPASAASIFSKNFPFAPSDDQQALFERLEMFLAIPAEDRPVFILSGYAGTGKTTVIRTMSKSFEKLGLKTILMAPTGRAAKIISQYTRRKAYTIHRLIYKQTHHPYSGNIQTELQKNYQQQTLYIVDEASMISHQEGMGGHHLLQDLIAYVFSNPDNRLIFIGDIAQLPPVGQNLSLALDKYALSHQFGLEVQEQQLTQVVRHQQESGILEIATYLRHLIPATHPKLALHTSSYQDVFSMSSEKLVAGLSYAYLTYGIANTLVICSSNQEANEFNQFIRTNVLHRHSEIEEGDLIMIARNNYQALPKKTSVGFLANGEFAEIVEVTNIEEAYDMRFANVLLRLPDYPKQSIFKSKILLDTLSEDAPNLSDEVSKALYEKVSQDYQHIPQRSRQLKSIRKDAYLNALQIKYAYALTCHKAQGGQWDCVFVQPHKNIGGAISPQDLRWLYTATTRAKQKLFFVDLTH